MVLKNSNLVSQTNPMPRFLPAILCYLFLFLSLPGARSQVISTYAGIGTGGFGGDGGPASAALINLPSGIAYDASGNLFITDFNNNRVRKITPAGIISTVAGNGTPAFGGDGGPALAASLNNPNGLCLDAAGNLYIADYNNFRVRKVNTSGIISTVAGNGTSGSGGDGGPATAAQFNFPGSIVIDPAGNMYIADWANFKVRKVNTSGIISTIAGTGTG